MATRGTGPKPYVTKMLKQPMRTQAIHASQGHPAVTGEENERVPKVNCGPASPPK